MRSLRILLAEDDTESREMLAEFLELQGHVVAVAIDGAAAMALAVVFTPDVVLTDICMPRLNGVELCQRLREDPRTRDVPVLAMTALPPDGYDLGSGGFNAVFVKPLELEALGEHVSEACDRKRQLQR